MQTPVGAVEYIAGGDGQAAQVAAAEGASFAGEAEGKRMAINIFIWIVFAVAVAAVIAYSGFTAYENAKLDEEAMHMVWSMHAIGNRKRPQ